jgi:hypothetical protein
MAEATTTNAYRKKLATDCLTALQAGGKMAFGDGGHSAQTLAALPPDPAATALASEKLRSDLVSVIKEDDYSVTATGRIDATDLAGVFVSEAGLFMGSILVGFRNFAPKVKESDEAYDITIKLKF